MSAGHGSPSSYEVDGVQYVSVSMGPAVWAFKLRGTIPPAHPPAVSPSTEQLSVPVDTDEIDTASLQSVLFGAGPHYFVDEFRFAPYRSRIRVGSKVTFVNNGNMRHEIVALDGSWGTGPLSPAEEAWISFETPGEYTYICKDHPWSYGQIIVVPDGPPQRQLVMGISDGQERSQNFPRRAARGQLKFKTFCNACHGDNSRLAGAPALIGATFTSHWENARIGELFDKIRTTMPQASPGSLDQSTYLDIVAYLLRVNEFFARDNDEVTDDPQWLRTRISRH
jgi:hypothetical protein